MVIKLKKIIFLALLLAMVAGGGGPVFAGDIVSTISGGVLSLTTTADVISAYSLKKGCVEVGAGFGFLKIDLPTSSLWIANLIQQEDVDIAVLGSQQNAIFGLNIGTPLKSFEKSALTIIWPGLDKLDGGIVCGWGYSIKTGDDGNTYFTWSGIDYGLSLTLKY